MNEPLRLAYLVSQYPAVNHTYLLAEITQLRKAGVEVHVASMRAPDRTLDRLTWEEREEAKRTFYVQPRGVLPGVRAQLAELFSHPLRYAKGILYALALGGFYPRRTAERLFYFMEAVIIADWMRSLQLTHAHTHFTSTVGLILSRIFPVTVSATIHGPAEFEDPYGFHLPAKLRGAVFVRTISYFGRSQMMRVSDHREWDKIEVARLGVDPERFRPKPVVPDPACFEIISVGRLSPEKAQHVLIAAMDILVRRGRQVRLRLVGDGPDRRSLEEHVASRGLGGHVIFEGWVDQDRIPELYGQADICALASFLEGIPVALMEPMAMGIPCVATRITGIPELIEDGKSGLLVAPSDHEALAASMARLMDDAELRSRIAKAARHRIVEEYDLARNTGLLAGIFRRRLTAR